jgi:hypothetical protein
MALIQLLVFASLLLFVVDGFYMQKVEVRSISLKSTPDGRNPRNINDKAAQQGGIFF